MGNNKIFSGIFAAILAFGLSCCSVLCFGTAFGGYLSFHRESLMLICLFTSIFAATAFSFRYGKWVVLGLLALVTGYALGSRYFMLQVEALVNAISRVGNAAYDWPILSWSGTPLNLVPVTLCLGAFGALISISCAWVTVQKKWSVWALIPALIPFGACFIATDLVPETGCIFWFLLCVALLIFTQTVRVRNSLDGVKLTAILLIPLFLAAILLFAWIPQDGYEQQVSDLRQQVLSWFNGLPFVTPNPDGTLSVGTQMPQNLDLSTVGAKSKLRYAVLDVLSDRTENLYLRGQCLDSYTGTGWLVSEHMNQPDIYWPREGLEAAGQVQIEIRTGRSVLFFPYYAQGEPWTNSFPGGSLPNPEGLRSYTMERYVPGSSGAKASFKETNEMYDACLTLPVDTFDWAQTLVQELGILQNMHAEEKVQIICDYVSQSAEYDLNTPRMPEDETDFARWFLMESDTGYCIHFATAATVLLRAAGVPARYVSGYADSVVGGLRKTVTADKAHAWVEYIHPTQGWTVLDPTPAEEPEPTESTAAPTEEPTTEPTQGTATEPTQTTATRPTETTKPTQTTAPTEPVQEEPQKETPGWVKTALWWLAGVFGLCAATALQYELRKNRRKKAWHRGTPNHQALLRWRYILRLCKLLKQQPPEALDALAEKAKFSQHTLTDQELHQFSAFIRTAHGQIANKPPLVRFAWMLIFAIG